jgi:uncharacterized membrane protein
MLGGVIYATYELTNHCILAPWTWGLALADTAWGALACAATSAVQLSLARWVGAR